MMGTSLVFSAALCLFQEPTAAREQLSSLLDEAVRLSKVRGFSSAAGEDVLTKVAEAEREFGRVLNQIAALGASAAAGAAPGAAGEFDIRPRLLSIAADRKQRPEVYREIHDYYVSTEGIEHPKRSGEGRSLQDRHALEKYRLAWEHTLIAPLAGPNFLEERAIRALQRIKNPDSLAALVHFYTVTCQETSAPSHVATLQTWLLEGLSHFASPDALRAILECLAASEGLPPKGAGVNRFEPEEALRKLWASWKAGGAEVGKAWEKILEQFPASQLGPKKAAILGRLRTVFFS